MYALLECTHIKNCLITGSKITTAEAGGEGKKVEIDSEESPRASEPHQDPNWAVAFPASGYAARHTPASNPDRLTAAKGSQGQAGGGGGRIASTGGEGNLHRQSGPVTVTSGGWRWE
ncbi:hypothetical protein BY996DRAFT_6417096 [Phakopsora pachyrhizi]|nr:hypothetical protein BY996DRAFT_6417096 [Phakopsora pachyrhizi]